MSSIKYTNNDKDDDNDYEKILQTIWQNEVYTDRLLRNKKQEYAKFVRARYPYPYDTNPAIKYPNNDKDDFFQSIWQNKVFTNQLQQNKQFKQEYKNFVRARYLYDTKPNSL